MKIKLNAYAVVRRIVAACSLIAMTTVFFAPVAASWLGWLPRLQLVPAILTGAVLELVILVISVALFGRLYCAVLCPLGIAQDLVRFCFGWLPWRNVSARGSARKRVALFSQIVRYAVLALFVLSMSFGFVAVLEPYGIFGRFLSVGICRAGEPAHATVAWAVGLMATILVLALFRARFWCNHICPVGTFLGIFSRWAIFRVRINARKCVGCGACVRVCEKGALRTQDDKSVVVDSSSCIACGNCLAACSKGTLTYRA